MLNWENGLYECEDCRDYEGQTHDLTQIIELGSDFDCGSNQVVEYYQSRLVCLGCFVEYCFRITALPQLPLKARSLHV